MRPKPESERVGRPRTANDAPSGYPDSARTRPRKPAGMSAAQKVTWNRIERMQLPHTDKEVPLLVRYCELTERRELLKSAFEETGVYISGAQGQRVINPVLTQIDKVESQMMRLETLLLLTPDSRARFGVADDEAEDDGFESF